MGEILNVLVYTPFSWILVQLYHLTGSYGFAIILFSLITKLILLPLSMKGKKGMLQTSRMQPKLQAVQKKYKEDKQKQQEAISKLYESEGVSPMGGCLWSLLPLPIFFALYALLRQPLTYLMGLSKDSITKIMELLGVSAANGAYEQLTVAQDVYLNFSTLSAKVPELLNAPKINFMFLGINLAEVPQLGFNLAIIIPILSGLAAFAQQQISQKAMVQPTAADSTTKGMNGMMKFMPLLSVWFGFIMPAAMGVYWIANSIFTAVQELLLNKHYMKILDEEDARKAQLEARRRAAEEALKLEAQQKREENKQKQIEGKKKKGKS